MASKEVKLRLRVDDQGVKQGLDEAADGLEKIEKQSEDTTRVALGGFEKLSVGIIAANAALDLAAAAARSVGQAFESVFTGPLAEIDRIHKMAAATGLATEELSGLRVAAELSGVSIEQFSTGLGILAQKVAAASTGSREAQSVFSALGVELGGSTMSTLDDLADRFAALPDSIQKTALAQQFFGESGRLMIPLLNQGAAGIADLRKQAEELGVVFDGKTGRAAEEVNDNMARLALSVEGVKNEIAAGLLPIVSPMVENLLDWAKANREVLAADFGAFFEGVAKGAAAVLPIVQLMARAIGSIASGVGDVAAATTNGFAGTDVDTLAGQILADRISAETNPMRRRSMRGQFENEALEAARDAIAIDAILAEEDRAARRSGGGDLGAGDTSAIDEMLAKIKALREQGGAAAAEVAKIPTAARAGANEADRLAAEFLKVEQSAEAASINVGETLNNGLQRAVDGLIGGDLDLANVMRGTGQAIASELFGAMLEEKLDFDLAVERNFLQDIPAMIGAGAKSAASLWGESMQSMSASTGQAADAIGGALRNVPGVGNVSSFFVRDPNFVGPVQPGGSAHLLAGMRDEMGRTFTGPQGSLDGVALGLEGAAPPAGGLGVGLGSAAMGMSLASAGAGLFGIDGYAGAGLVAGAGVGGLAAGAMAGGIGGPVGALIGAVVGMVAGVIAEALNQPRTLEGQASEFIPGLFASAGVPISPDFFGPPVHGSGNGRLETAPGYGSILRSPGFLAGRDPGKFGGLLTSTTGDRFMGRGSSGEALGMLLGLEQPELFAQGFANTVELMGVSAAEADRWLGKLVDTTGLSFVPALDRLNTLFLETAITEDQLADGVQGIIKLFRDDIPAALDTTGIAARNMINGRLDVAGFDGDLAAGTQAIGFAGDLRGSAGGIRGTLQRERLARMTPAQQLAYFRGEGAAGRFAMEEILADGEISADEQSGFARARDQVAGAGSGLLGLERNLMPGSLSARLAGEEGFGLLEYAAQQADVGADLIDATWANVGATDRLTAALNGTGGDVTDIIAGQTRGSRDIGRTLRGEITVDELIRNTSYSNSSVLTADFSDAVDLDAGVAANNAGAPAGTYSPTSGRWYDASGGRDYSLVGQARGGGSAIHVETHVHFDGVTPGDPNELGDVVAREIVAQLSRGLGRRAVQGVASGVG